MGAPLTYKWTEDIFRIRRKKTDFKAYKTDVHLTKGDDGVFTFSYVQFKWEKDKKTGKVVKGALSMRVPLVTITPDNVMTLLAPADSHWPSVQRMTIRNRLHDITGFSIYSNTSRHKNKETAIRMEHKYYDNGWVKQSWCASGSMPYKPGTQFNVGIDKGKVDCINPPADIKNLVKNEAIQQAKADTVIIRKLAMVMLRVGFDEHLDQKLDRYWYAPQILKKLDEIDYKNPTGDDAMAVLCHGLRTTSRPDEHVFNDTTNSYGKRSRDEQLQILRSRVLENGMKALRKHIYTTTGGYEQVEA